MKYKQKTQSPEYRITCRNCGHEFITTRSQKVYCSLTCYERTMARNAYKNKKARENDAPNNH